MQITSGTILVNIMKEEPKGSAEDVYNHVKESVAKNYDLKLLDPLDLIIHIH